MPRGDLDIQLDVDNRIVQRVENEEDILMPKP